MDRTVIAGSLLAILGAPWLGSSASLVSNTLVRFLLLCFVLYSIQQSELTGLLSVLAVVSLISERNHYRLTTIPHRMQIPMKRDSVFQAAHPVPTAHGIDADTEVLYSDNNPRISPAPTGARSAKFYMDKQLAV
jgi:hypothetical protein